MIHRVAVMVMHFDLQDTINKSKILHDVLAADTTPVHHVRHVGEPYANRFHQTVQYCSYLPVVSLGVFHLINAPATVFGFRKFSA